MLTKNLLRIWIAPVSLISFSAQAGSLQDVVQTYRQNRYALRNGSGSYDKADVAVRGSIQGYYAELEAAALLAPVTTAIEKTAQNSYAMVKAIDDSTNGADPISSEVRMCMGSQDLGVHQKSLQRSAKSARAQLDFAYDGWRGGSRAAPVEIDVDSAVEAYNAISASNWTQRFQQCCKEKAQDKLQRVGSNNKNVEQSDALRSANDRSGQRLDNLANGGGCERLAENIAKEQTVFVSEDYALPSRVQDPLQGLKMSPEELDTVLRSSSVRSTLRNIRETSTSSTAAMFAEQSYFEDIDYACKKAKDEAFEKENGIFPTLVRTGLNAAICHVIPLVATENWSTKSAGYSYMAADITQALPWQDLRCDPNETAAYRAQRPTTRKAVADKWNIGQMQNNMIVNNLRGMVPLNAMPVVRSPDGSVILPGGILGGTTPSRAEIEAQYLAQQENNGIAVGGNVSVNRSTASRQLGFVDGVNSGSRLAFLAGPAGSTRYVRPVGRALASRSQASVQGARTLASNIESGSTRAPQSAVALRQVATQGRTLASSIVNAQSGRSLAALSSRRVQSATVTRNLVGRSIASKSSRISAEWVASVLRDRRAGTQTPSTGGVNVPQGNGGRVKEPTDQERQDKIVDELVKANERRRQSLIAQADSMINSIQKAVSRSGEIVAEIQKKITARDVMFNKTVEKMVPKTPDDQFSMVKNLLTQDARSLQEIGVLKAEYDALASSIPMLTNSLNRLGGLAPQIQTQVGSALGNSQFANLPTAGANGRFSSGNTTSVFAPASNVEAPAVSSTVNTDNVSFLRSPLESLAERLFMPKAWAIEGSAPGTVAYEKRWAEAYDRFATEWDSYVDRLRAVEQADRQALVNRFRALNQSPNKLELKEPDAATFGFMWDTMEVVSDEAQALLRNRRTESKGDVARGKVYQDVETAQQESEKAMELLMDWAYKYAKSGPKGYYEDPQVWEGLIADTILY